MEKVPPEPPIAHETSDPFGANSQAMKNTRLLHGVDSTLKRPTQMVHELMHGQGSQGSWIFSAFLAMPGIPEPLFNSATFAGSFYEYLRHILAGEI